MHLFLFYRPIATAFTPFLFFSPAECNGIGRHYHKRDIAKCQPNKVHTALTLLVNRILPDGPNAFFCHYRRVAINFFSLLLFYYNHLICFSNITDHKGSKQKPQLVDWFFFSLFKRETKKHENKSFTMC